MHLNGIEYQESNYHGYWWFWTWPFLALQDWCMPRNTVVAPGPGLVRYADLGIWAVFARCPCGVGYEYKTRAEAVHGVKNVVTAIATGAERWLCGCCGRGLSTTVSWVGRRFANRWEWKPESELPEDLRPKRPHLSNEDALKAAAEVDAVLDGYLKQIKERA